VLWHITRHWFVPLERRQCEMMDLICDLNCPIVCNNKINYHALVLFERSDYIDWISRFHFVLVPGSSWAIIWHGNSIIADFTEEIIENDCFCSFLDNFLVVFVEFEYCRINIICAYFRKIYNSSALAAKQGRKACKRLVFYLFLRLIPLNFTFSHKVRIF
jgi:hypothetical protein